ncbi:MAG TPA: YfhO family protein [Methylomirabilota bacterium]|nr:YfhO family protein [Methylomirabilota bacterium]
MTRHAERIAVVVLVLLPFVLFSPALLPGRVLSPLDNLFVAAPWHAVAPGPVQPNPALMDVTQVFHPWLLYGAREVAAGRFPLWNPYAYTGAPFFSNPQTATLFPLTWLGWILPPALALTLPSLLKLVAAGLAMYWFLRLLAVAALAAFVGATGYMLSSTLIAWLPWTFATTMAFIPLLFALIERLARRGRPRDIALLAAAVGLDVLAGYPQATMHTLIAVGAWAVARAPWRGTPAAFLLRAAAAVVLGLALAAAQLLPALDYVRESAVYAYRSQWTPPLAVPPASAVTALLPYFFGTSTQTWSRWQFAVTSVYVGLVPLVALPLTALGWRRSPTRFFAALTAVTAAVHFGAPLAAALATAPGMALSNNLRLMPILAFGLCTLGALGLDAAARGACPAVATIAVRVGFVLLVVIVVASVALAAADPRSAFVRPTLVVQGVAALAGLTAAALALLGWLRDRRARWGVALAAVQVASLAPLVAYQPVRDTRWLYPRPPALAWLSEHVADARVLEPASAGFLYGLREAHGYDGLGPRRVEQLLGPVGTGNAALSGYRENTVALHGSEPLSAAAVLLSPARDLAGVRFIVLAPGTAPPRPDFRLIYDAGDARIFEIPTALPRVFVARRARCVDDGTALRLLRSRAVDPVAEVLLGGCATPLPAGAVARDVDARIVRDGPDTVRVTAITDAPAWLVLTDTWFPGWRARIDGAEAPVLRAHHAFRAVALTPGRHDVEFTFRPRGLVTGAVISLVALAGVLALCLRRVRALVTAVGAAVVLAGGSAEATLPESPLALSVSPTTLEAGQSAEVTLTPRVASGRWDVYVVWLYSERAAFLGEDGEWHPRPVPFRAGLSAGAPVSGRWRNAGPPGPATLALLAVDPGTDPLDRLGWRWRPSLASVRIRRPVAAPIGSGSAPVVLAAVAIVAVALVLSWPRGRPAHPSSPPATLV